jgi:hypothetical protein
MGLHVQGLVQRSSNVVAVLTGRVQIRDHYIEERSTTRKSDHVIIVEIGTKLFWLLTIVTVWTGVVYAGTRGGKK